MSRSLRFLVLSGGVLLVGLAVLLVRTPHRPSAPPLPVLHQVGDFAVTNQAGNRVESADLHGRPWAINLIFTRCPGPCPRLTAVMREIQGSLPSGSRAGLMTVTSDPEFDTPAVLQAYAEKFGANTNRWQFVTGTKAGIRRLAVEQLLLVLVDKEEAQRTSPEDLFLHSTLIVVMDAQGRLRTAVEGIEPGAPQKVVAALRQLEEEAHAGN